MKLCFVVDEDFDIVFGAVYRGPGGKADAISRAREMDCAVIEVVLDQEKLKVVADYLSREPVVQTYRGCEISAYWYEDEKAWKAWTRFEDEDGDNLGCQGKTLPEAVAEAKAIIDRELAEPPPPGKLPPKVWKELKEHTELAKEVLDRLKVMQEE